MFALLNTFFPKAAEQPAKRKKGIGKTMSYKVKEIGLKLVLCLLPTPPPTENCDEYFLEWKAAEVIGHIFASTPITKKQITCPGSDNSFFKTLLECVVIAGSKEKY